MSSPKEYPDLSKMIEQTEDGHITLRDNQELQKMFYDDRYNLMEQKRDELISNIKRYMKTKKRYVLANNIQKVTSLVVTSSLTVATIVLTSGLAVPFFFIPTASGISLFFIGLTASIEKIIKRKKTHIKKKITSQQELLTTANLYMERAREDGIVTFEEVTKFNKMMDRHRETEKKESGVRDRSGGNTAIHNKSTKVNVRLFSPSINFFVKNEY